MNKLQTISTVLFAISLVVLPIAVAAVQMHRVFETTGIVLASI